MMTDKRLEEMKRIAVLALALVLSACTPCEEVGPVCLDTGDLTADEAALVREKLPKLIDVSLAWWGANPERSIHGWTVRFARTLPACAGDVEPDGCAYSDRSMVVRLFTAPERPRCLLALAWALPHEIGHTVHGMNHDDPAWMREGDLVQTVLRSDPECLP